jgi:ribonuclease HII
MKIILGIDEVGRGCWAGPLVAGAVILPAESADIHALRQWKLGDSKKLSKKQREDADQHIRKEALGLGLGWVTPEEVDTIGLTEAVRLAMRRAVEQITHAYDELIIDGNYNFLPDMPLSSCLIKADDVIPSVSAASIIAKVARDKYMEEAASLHPQYGFESHVGYGTKKHQEALASHGITPLHRKSYKPIKAYL